MSRGIFATAGAAGSRCASFGIAATRAVLLASALLAVPRPSEAARKIVVQLHHAPQFEFAGYYAALWQGFYRDAGLDVEIRPGASPGTAPIDPVREVADGRAQFGTGTMRLVIRAAQGLRLLLLAPIFQRSGAAVYYRADSSYPSPAALVKARLGRPPASNILSGELATALRGEGLDPAKLQFTVIDPGGTVTALADHKVDAAIGSAWDVPWQARERGIALKSFDPADYRVEFYGDTLFTLQRIEAVAPSVVQGFRAASLKGWDYALQHADEIAGRMLAELPIVLPVTDPIGFAHYQAALARRLARYPDVPLGHSNRERWRRIEASLAAAGGIQGTANVEDIVYDPEMPVGTDAGRHTGRILAEAIIAAMAIIIAALWWRRWRTLRTEIGMANEGPAASAPHAGRFSAVFAPLAARRAAVASACRRPAASSIRHARRIARRLAVIVRRQRRDKAGVADLNTALSGLDRPLARRLSRPVALRLSLLPGLWPCAAEPWAVTETVIDLAAAAAAEVTSSANLVIGTRNVSLDPARAAELAAPIGDYVRVTVRDSGPGIADAAFEHLFDPATTVKPAIAAAGPAARRLGGFVGVETAEGVGTAVHLFFPRAGVRTDAPPAQAAE
jgi:ABC-type nitrate/sulfonate/bicarbonate transport system substrate-binding protein